MDRHPVTTAADLRCRWCAQPSHAGICPLVKALEFHPDGITISRVEFKTAADFPRFSGWEIPTRLKPSAIDAVDPPTPTGIIETDGMIRLKPLTTTIVGNRFPIASGYDGC